MQNVTFEEATKLTSNLRTRIQDAIFGQEDLVIESLCCLLAGGHILMTGAPGLAKTTLVRVIAANLGLEFNRVQFTPDLLPTDIIGSEILNIEPGTGRRSFEFAKGPIFTNLLLADEINRASPRTQSALLEGMQERTCTVAGMMHKLPYPFMVFATQNPFESEGTFPLPEAQLDRFLVHSLVDYPSAEAEQQILRAHSQSSLVGERSGGISASEELSPSQLVGLIEKAKDIRIDDELQKVVAALVRSSRPGDESCPADLKEVIWYGAGPRAGISLISLSRAYALLNGEEAVRWAHLRRMAVPALRHRIRLTAQAGRDRANEDQVVNELLHRLENKHKFLAKGIA